MVTVQLGQGEGGAGCKGIREGLCDTMAYDPEERDRIRLMILEKGVPERGSVIERPTGQWGWAGPALQL